MSYFKGSARANETASLVRSAGREVHVGKVDLREEAEVRRFVDEAAEHFGGVHTAVYAAGPYIPMRFIGQQPASAFREIMEHDAFGCFNLIQAVLPHLRTAKGSFTALVTPAIRRYAIRDILSAAPKAAIEALVKGLAAEEGRFGVRANAVGVGVITDGLYHALVESGDFDQRFLDASRQVMALKRLGTADEVAEGVGLPGLVARPLDHRPDADGRWRLCAYETRQRLFRASRRCYGVPVDRAGGPTPADLALRCPMISVAAEFLYDIDLAAKPSSLPMSASRGRCRDVDAAFVTWLTRSRRASSIA